jgi:hypothetical protein
MLAVQIVSDQEGEEVDGTGCKPADPAGLMISLNPGSACLIRRATVPGGLLTRSLVCGV